MLASCSPKCSIIGTAGVPIEVLADAAHVVAHRGVHRQRARAQPRQLAAPAVAEQRDAAGVTHDIDRRGDVLQRILVLQLRQVAARALHVLGRVAGGDVMADAVVQRRRDGQVAGGGILVGDMADVLIDAEDFLQDHHGAARMPRQAPRSRR